MDEGIIPVLRFISKLLLNNYLYSTLERVFAGVPVVERSDNRVGRSGLGRESISDACKHSLSSQLQHYQESWWSPLGIKLAILTTYNIYRRHLGVYGMLNVTPVSDTLPSLAWGLMKRSMFNVISTLLSTRYVIYELLWLNMGTMAANRRQYNFTVLSWLHISYMSAWTFFASSYHAFNILVDESPISLFEILYK